jgi:hypothetical protein
MVPLKQVLSSMCFLKDAWLLTLVLPWVYGSLNMVSLCHPLPRFWSQCLELDPAPGLGQEKGKQD